jgi:hypothetical protein
MTKEQRFIYNKRYYRLHREAVLKQKKQYHIKNRDRDIKRCKNYDANHKEQKIITDKLRYDKNRVQILKQKKQYSMKHKEKIKAYQKQHKTTDGYKKQSKHWHLKTNYNIGLDDYNDLFNAQEGCCIICDVHQSNLKKPLFVDHDHVTGKVRGLLCSACNSLLGYAHDNISILESAIKYLKNNLK